jgi:predicted GIY-YIG superfamily endonuclease
METRLERELQQMAHCVYSIPCECGRSYIGETGRALTVRLCEHDHNFKDGLLEISKLSKHAYDEGHKVIWDEAMIFGN